MSFFFLVEREEKVKKSKFLSVRDYYITRVLEWGRDNNVLRRELLITSERGGIISLKLYRYKWGSIDYGNCRGNRMTIADKRKKKGNNRPVWLTNNQTSGASGK